MNLFSVFRELLERSIALLGILVDVEGQRRLADELEMIEAEVSGRFHRQPPCECNLSWVQSGAHPRYGPISAWHVNYCLGIARINPLTGNRVTNRHYALSPEHIRYLLQTGSVALPGKCVDKDKRGFSEG